MGIVLDSTETFEAGEIILARAEGRSVEIELEPIRRSGSLQPRS